jgi:cyclopropane fatty-acyl-phospholipid synthase-like methyltransferase
MMRKLFFHIAYLQKPVWDTGISPPELLDFIATHNPGRALDMGCGTGTNAITLAKHGWQVVGVDFVKRAINLARQNAEQYGVDLDLRVDDVTRLDSVSGRFDLILDMGCFHSLPPTTRQSYILKIDRLLTDSGTFLLYLFMKSNPDSVGPGATIADILFITENLRLIGRIDSTERGVRPSAWLTLQKKSQPGLDG